MDLVEEALAFFWDSLAHGLVLPIANVSRNVLTCVGRDKPTIIYYIGEEKLETALDLRNITHSLL